MTPILRWEKPPAPSQRAVNSKRGQALGAWAEVLEALQHQPGRWALILDSIQQHKAMYLSNGINLAAALLAPGRYEARSVSAGGGLARVFARYLASEEPSWPEDLS